METGAWTVAGILAIAGWRLLARRTALSGAATILASLTVAALVIVALLST
jgi:hypothetical protein